MTTDAIDKVFEQVGMKSERLTFVRQMILKLRQALLDGNEVVSISSGAGAVTYNRTEMEERLKDYEQEERRLEGRVSPGPLYETIDFKGIRN